MDVNTSQFTPPEVGTIDTSAATDLMNTKPDIAMNVEPTVSMPDASLENPSRLQALATNTKEAASNVGQNMKDYFVGEESTFVPDTIAGLGSGVIAQQFAPEQEERGRGFIADPTMQVQAQGAYLSEVGPMMANVTGVPNFSNFTQIANQNVYGIGTPNHLAGLYG